MILVVILAGAHTYDPDTKNDWKINDIREEGMVWGIR